jgi:hypothetical protein
MILTHEAANPYDTEHQLIMQALDEGVALWARDFLGFLMIMAGGPVAGGAAPVAAIEAAEVYGAGGAYSGTAFAGRAVGGADFTVGPVAGPRTEAGPLHRPGDQALSAAARRLSRLRSVACLARR